MNILKKLTFKKVAIVGAVLWLLVAYVFDQLAKPSAPAQFEGLAKVYSIENTETQRKASDRQQLILNIQMSSASTDEERAATMVQAALDAYREARKKPDSVAIFMRDNNAAFNGILSGQMGMLTLYVDGCGLLGDTCNGVHWEISVADNQQPSQKEYDVIRLWNQNRSQFQVNGMTDEKALKSYIGEQLQLSEVQVFSYDLFAKEYQL